ncbi:MAG: ABC transporter permease [Chloroflexi bacterium]|nr:ABC transporter permease [Chloroflexota bacterium]
MFRTPGRKIWRDISARWWRTLLVSSSVFVGVLGVVVMTTVGQLLSQQLKRDLRPGEMAMLRVFVDTVPGARINNEQVLATLRQLPHVVQIEAQAVYNIQWRQPGESGSIQGELYAYSEPFGAVHLEPVRLVAGRYPRDGQAEIAIERRMAKQYDLTPGSVIEQQAVDGTFQPVTVVGIVFQPYMYIGGGDGSHSMYTSYEDARQWIGFSGFSSFYVRYTDFYAARQNSADFRKTLEKQTPYRAVYYVRTDPAQNPFLVSIQQIARILSALSILLLAVACLLVANIIHVMIARQRSQVGAMKSIGATRLHILIIYLGQALCYGLIGTVPGVIVGSMTGQWAAGQLAPLANTVLQDAGPSWEAIGRGLALGLLMPFLTAFIPAWRASQIPILDTMFDTGIRADYGRGLLPWLIKLAPLPVPLIQVINRIFQHKVRLALTFTALTAAGAAFMSMLAVVDTLDDVLKYVDERLGRKVAVTLESMDVSDLRQSLFMEPKVQAVQPGVAVELQVMHEPEDKTAELDGPIGEPVAESEEATDTLFIAGLDLSDLPQITLSEGAVWSPETTTQGLILAASAAETYGKTIGDSLTLQSPNNTAVFPIVGIADFPLEIGFMEWQQLRDFVGEIREAPTPNAYWEPIEIDSSVSWGENGLWAIGLDEQAGQLLNVPLGDDPTGIIISRAVAEAGGWQVGDVIDLLLPEQGLVEGILIPRDVERFTVLAVLDITPAQMALFGDSIPPQVDRDHPAVVGLLWWRLAELAEFNYDKIIPDTFEIDLFDPALNGNHTAVHPVFRNQDSFSERVAQTMLGISGMMSLAALLMALVGGIGLLTIMSVNVFDRQREIGVLRSVGATSEAILFQFLLEGLFIGVGAWVAGLPLSYFLTGLLVTTMPFSDLIRFQYVWFVPVLGLGSMILITTLATLYPAMLAARQTISEILRYK